MIHFFLVLTHIFIDSAIAWTVSLSDRHFVNYNTPRSFKRYASTPFESDLYIPPENESSRSALAVPDDTQLVLGINKYSHDTSLCAADANTGQVLFALSKERISRRKHDSGNIASLVEVCLESLDLQLENIQKVVMNNHHHRILPLEENKQFHMEWESALNMNAGHESGYDEPENTLPDAERMELSHHLAHAYSTAAQAPFDAGLCVVMDGMGDTYRTMLQAQVQKDNSYVSDLTFGADTFQCIPSNIQELAASSPFDFREAESVYQFRKQTSENGAKIDIWPIFKRFTRENSPPTLYNHGFENMDGLGAVYSRASTHIFGDWNSCGKVMGLAPWAGYRWTDSNGYELAPRSILEPTMTGSVYIEQGDNALKLDKALMEKEPYCTKNDPELFNPVDGTMRKRYDFDDDDFTSGDKAGRRLPASVALNAISLASRVQEDLEEVGLDFVNYFKEKTGETNLCLAGGVALNSVLNGRLARDIGFEQTFISPYPGDDGIAVGCCAFGLFGNSRLGISSSIQSEKNAVRVWDKPLSPYQGPSYADDEIKDAIEHARPWLEIDVVRDEDQRLELMAREVESGGVIAWYRSRSELGPRALGHRSILADPRKKGLVRFINEEVKSRESFRPFAPSVLAEEADKWFAIGESRLDNNVSPFMSMTAIVHKAKRAIIPAVTHVDGSSRLQTVTREDEPIYHKFISKFFEITGVPMVLNTSFNTLPSEPIVETPHDAIRSFLYSMGSIEMLVMEDYIIKRKRADVRKLLGEASNSGTIKTEPSFPRRTGFAYFESSFTLEDGNNENVSPKTRVKMPDRPMHGNKNEWFELLDDLEGEILSVCDGQVSLNDIMTFYTAVEQEEALGEKNVADAQNILQNTVHRLVRLYEHTLISW
ncbi:carbamoyltransferase [Fistulifera solaris]|uniref:Carbamoyltransferase n=1 Tax=Fistulifera solaris TaxID=1519565 RepID=A0A1Z5J7W4_FISSO|nr:carbamoyltransferase [Fistulifera solaris]|eukprot:GAX09908.1 carbamoyltransferase [Fistulifera solaris]